MPGNQYTYSRFIYADADKIYRALTEPGALKIWRVPGEMTAAIHSFQLKVGGGYEMSLFYPGNDTLNTGKTRGKEDRFIARYLSLEVNRKVTEAIRFVTDQPGFEKEMIMEIELSPRANGTMVSITYKNLPEVINPEDNEIGTLSSLKKLAVYVAQ